MNLTRRTLLAALALAPLPAFAQGRPPEAGVDYSELRPPQPIETTGKVEVLEFFWYGCPHCYSLEPQLEKWIAVLPKDVAFRRVPAVFNDTWARDAGIFYTFEALGVLERVHRPFFDAIHKDRLNVGDPAARDAWLQKQGVDSKRFEDAFRSFGVQTKVRRARQLSIAYRIDGTPALAVQGRYTISAEQARTQSNMLVIADYLIGVARKSG
jgi:thiol:disulfide interchange protein DsbA